MTEKLLREMIEEVTNYFLDPTPKDPWLLCDGRMIKYDDYPDLFKILRMRYGGNVGLFRLPDITTYIAEHAGYYIKAKHTPFDKGILIGQTTVMYFPISKKVPLSIDQYKLAKK